MTEESVLLLIIAWFVSGVIGFTLLNSSGRGWTGFGLGALLGPIGWIIAAIMRLERPAPAAHSRGSRFCPDCGAGLPADARFCPSCGHSIQPTA
jgi:hypothetical protein